MAPQVPEMITSTDLAVHKGVHRHASTQPLEHPLTQSEDHHNNTSRESPLLPQIILRRTHEAKHVYHLTPLNRLDIPPT